MADLRRWFESLGLGRHGSALAERDVDPQCSPTLDERGPRSEGEGHPGAAERRQITVLFCDLVGSTELSERLDLEDFQKLIQSYLETCKRAVDRHGGYWAETKGDGVIVYYGFPFAHEDDARRAVWTGLDIIAAVRKLDARLEDHLAVRIGVDTGEVIVGGDLHGEATQGLTAIGSTPNRAARLQELAEPNALFLSANTRKLAGRTFDYIDVGEARLKGFSNAVRVYRVAGPTGIESRFEAMHEEEVTPLCGRGEELDRLEECWRRLEGDEGQVVVVKGDPGIGKSRVVRAFCAKLPREVGVRVLHCSDRHQHTAFHPFLRELERVAGFRVDDSDEDKLFKLEALLSRMNDYRPEMTPLVAELLSIEAGARFSRPEMSGRRGRDLVIRALMGFLLHECGTAAAIIVIEDAHWMDPSSVEVTRALALHMPSTRILLLITLRGEPRSPWLRPSRVSTIALEPLTPPHVREIIRQLSRDRPMPAALVESIAERTDGVPLFVEELTKTLLESTNTAEADRETRGEGPVPATIKELLNARLDGLGAGKRVAQVGAAIGREFGHDLLAELWDESPVALADGLESLLRSGLVHERFRDGQSLYAFKHALVQETSHESLLRVERRRLHRRIAERLLRDEPDTARRHPESIAQHYTAGESYARAIEFWCKAAERASSVSANEEAGYRLQRGLDLLKALPDGSERDRLELELCLTLGDLLRATKATGMPETAAAYARARELGERVGSGADLARALYGEFVVCFNGARLSAALDIAGKLLKLGERRGDDRMIAFGHQARGMSEFSLGNFAAAQAHLERALEASDRVEPDRLTTEVQFPSMSLTFLSWSQFISGHHAESVAQSVRALEAARGESAFNLAVAMGNDCYLYQFLGDPDGLGMRALELMKLAGQKGFPVWLGVAQFFWGWTLAENGNAAEAMVQMWKSVGFVRDTLWHVDEIETPYYMAMLAAVRLKGGNLRKGHAWIGRALRQVNRTGERWYEAELHRLQGELALAGGSTGAAEAESCFERALAVARRQGAKSWELRAGLKLARLWSETGRPARARDLLEPLCAELGDSSPVRERTEARQLVHHLIASAR